MEAITPEVSVSGAVMRPRHSEVAETFAAGRLGLESAVLITRQLEKSEHRVPREAREAVEALMVGLACGAGPGQRDLPPVSVDYLVTQVRTLGAAIDPDGARPREERAARSRRFWIGEQDEDGIFPCGGGLTADVAIPLRRRMEAERRSPRFGDAAEQTIDDLAGAQDSRTPGQRRHDVLAEIVMTAIGADGAPMLNGRTAAVLVTVTAEELGRPGGLDGDPIGTMSGADSAVSRREVERFIDAGGYRAVTLDRGGAIVGIGSPERCFTTLQCLAIAARDGERCFAPGCTTPHTALQLHHVVPWREGGPTHTSNGILLCYWHHRIVDDGPWHYRMVEGVPEVRGPGIPEWTRRPDVLPRAA